MNNRNEIICLLKYTNRKGMDKLIEYMDKHNYWKCIGSTKYHSNFEGGMVQHCYMVYTLFNEMCNKFKVKIKEEEIIIISFLHDLCKLVQYDQEKLTMKYKYNNNKIYGHSKYTLKTLNELGFELTHLETISIQYHMGLYGSMEFDKLNGEYLLNDYVYISNKYPVIKLFHMCDEMSSFFLETRVE